MRSEGKSMLAYSPEARGGVALSVCKYEHSASRLMCIDAVPVATVISSPSTSRRARMAANL